MDKLIYMNEPFIVSHLKCGICKKPYNDPVSLPSPCERTYCRKCIQSNLQNHLEDCPECNKKPLVIEDLIPENAAFRRILNDILVQCSLCSKENIKRMDFLKHIEECCPKRIVNCRAAGIKCEWNGPYDELDNHWNNCVHEKLRPLLTELLNDRQQLDQLKIDSQNLADKSKQQENQIEQTRKEKENLEEKIKEMEINTEKESQQFKEQNEQKLKEIENLNEQIKQIEQLENQKKLLQQQYDEQLNDNDKFKDENQTLREQIDQIEKYENDLQELNEQLNQLSIENQMLDEETERLKPFELKTVDLTNQINDLDYENQLLKSEYDAFKSQLTNLYETFQKSLNEMSQLEIFNRTIQQQQIEIDSFNQENQQLKTQLDHLQSIQTDYQTLNYNYQLQLVQIKLLIKVHQVSQGKLNENKIRIEQLYIDNKRLEIKLEPSISPSTKSNDYTNDKLYDLIDQSGQNLMIKLIGEQLDDDDIDFLINKYLTTKTQYQSLILWNNSLSSNSLINLFSFLNINKTLTVLSISNNLLSDQSIQSLSQSLSFNNSTLQKLTLSSNQITDRGLIYLSDMLKSNQTLIAIGLQENQITDKSMKYFSEVIQFYNNAIEEICLYSNEFITDLSIDFLNNMIKTNQSLKTFWIWDCQLSKQSKFLLQQSIQDKTDFDLRL